MFKTVFLGSWFQKEKAVVLLRNFLDSSRYWKYDCPISDMVGAK